MLVRKVYGDDLSAQERTDQRNSPTAIDVQGFATVGVGHDFASIFTNRNYPRPAEEESSIN